MSDAFRARFLHHQKLPCLISSVYVWHHDWNSLKYLYQELDRFIFSNATACIRSADNIDYSPFIIVIQVRIRQREDSKSTENEALDY